MITFVTFHMECTPDAEGQIARENVLLADRSGYTKMIGLLFQSAAALHPDCRKVVVTDLWTDLSALPAGVEIYRCDMNPATMMLSRLRGYFDFVRRHDFASDVVLLDSDVLIVGDLAPVFQQGFHVGLTYRNHEEMPFNGGVIFLSRSDKAAVVAFLERVLSCYVGRFSEHAVWWGDQHALIEVIGRERLRACLSKREDRLAVDGVAIRLLPCAVYNFSPTHLWQAILAPFRGVHVIHFKGSRKRFIRPTLRVRAALSRLLGRRLMGVTGGQTITLPSHNMDVACRK